MNDKDTETLNRDTQAVLRGDKGAEDTLRKDAKKIGADADDVKDVIQSAGISQAMGLGNDLAAAGANFDGSVGDEPGDPAGSGDPIADLAGAGGEGDPLEQLEELIEQGGASGDDLDE